MMLNIGNMDFSAFSHGQIQSKLWLCNVLEAFLPNEKLDAAILGSWYNILGFMLASRMSHKFRKIDGYDKDKDAVETADKICQAWILDNSYISNCVADVNKINLNMYDLIINCSPEHMAETTWFDNIKQDTLVCLQTIDIQDTNPPWLIENPTKNLNEFIEKFPLRTYKFQGEMDFDYGSFGYKRFMIVGTK